MGNAGAAALIAQRLRGSPRQSDAFIELLEQHHTAIADDVSTIDRGLHDTASNLAKVNGLIGTLWRRQSSVGIGGQIPMTTRFGTRLPTYFS